MGVTGLVRGGAEMDPGTVGHFLVGRHQYLLNYSKDSPFLCGGRVRETRTEQRGTNAEQRGPALPGAH